MFNGEAGMQVYVRCMWVLGTLDTRGRTGGGADRYIGRRYPFVEGGRYLYTVRLLRTNEHVVSMRRGPYLYTQVYISVMYRLELSTAVVYMYL